MSVYLGLRFRLIVLMTTLLVVTVGVLYELNRRSEEQIRRQVSEQIKELTAAVDVGLKSISDVNYLEVIRQRDLPAEQYNRIKHIMITDSEGRVTDAANSNERGLKILIPNPGSSLVVAGDPLETDPTQATLHQKEEAKQTIFIPFRAAGVDGKPEINYVVVVMSSLRLDETLADTSRNRLLATIVVLLVGLLTSVGLVWRFTSPLGQLIKAVQRVADGDLQFHIGLRRKDEVGQLAASFDQMIDQLRGKQELEERLNQAERAAVIGRLASGIAHEIRNPLNFINLTIDHVRTKFPPAEVAGRALFDRLLISVKEEIARLNSLVNNVLRFGRPARLARKSILLRTIVESVFQVVQTQAQEQGVELKIDDQTGGQLIEVDAELMNSCLSNLAINGIQAMPEGGLLAVKLQTEPDGQVITVTDSGVGIPPDKLDQIFEPYYSTKETGIGLGLAVTRKLIEEHNGSITVRSTVGVGTTFVIRLPLSILEHSASSTGA